MSRHLLELEQKDVSNCRMTKGRTLALFLLKSLEPAEDGSIEEAWRIEAESRMSEIERGEDCLVPAEKVFENLRRRLT